MGSNLVLSCITNKVDATVFIPNKLNEHIRPKNGKVPSKIIAGVVYPALAVKYFDFVDSETIHESPYRLGLPHIGLEGLHTNIYMSSHNLGFDTSGVNSSSTCHSVLFGKGLGDVNMRFQREYGRLSRLGHWINGKINPDYKPLVEDLKNMRDDISKNIELIQCTVDGITKHYTPDMETGKSVCKICPVREMGISISSACDLEEILGNDILFKEMDRTELADYLIRTAKEMYRFDIEEDNVKLILAESVTDFLKSIKDFSDGRVELSVEKMKKLARDVKDEQKKVENKDYSGIV